MSEKDTESELHELFQDNNMDKNYIITNPTSNRILQETREEKFLKK